MSKEIKETKESYKISETALSKGYLATIDSRVFHVIKGGGVHVQDGFDPKSGKPIMKQVEALSDLSDQQLKELVYAGVIEMTPEQDKAFGVKFLSPSK